MDDGIVVGDAQIALKPEFTLSGFKTPSGTLTVMWPWGVNARK